MNNRQNGRRRGRGGVRPPNGGNLGNDRGSRIDNRSRGNASQLYEKYKTLARDAQTQGDRVMTEYYLQFADHYFRVLSENRPRFEEQQRRGREDGFDDDFDGEIDGDGGEEPRDPAPRQERQERQEQRYERGADQQREPRDYRDPRAPRDEQREQRAPRDEQRAPRDEQRALRDDREPRVSRDDRAPRDDRYAERMPDTDGEGGTAGHGLAVGSGNPNGTVAPGGAPGEPRQRRGRRTFEAAPEQPRLELDRLPPAISRPAEAIEAEASRDPAGDDAPPPRPRRTRRPRSDEGTVAVEA